MNKKNKKKTFSKCTKDRDDLYTIKATEKVSIPSMPCRGTNLGMSNLIQYNRR